MIQSNFKSICFNRFNFRNPLPPGNQYYLVYDTNTNMLSIWSHGQFINSPNLCPASGNAQGNNIDYSILSGYASEQQVKQMLMRICSLQAWKNSVHIPTKVSQLQNNARYISKQTDPQLANISGLFALKEDIDKLNFNGIALSSLVTRDQMNGALRLKADRELLSDIVLQLMSKAEKSEIPEIPSAVSYFTNDAKYLTEQVQPAFNQALSGLALKSQLFSGSYNDLTDKPPVIDPEKYATIYYMNQKLRQRAFRQEIPSAMSQLINDKGYLTQSSDTQFIKVKDDIVYKKDMPKKISYFCNDKFYQTKTDIQSIVQNLQTKINQSSKSIMPEIISGENDFTAKTGKWYVITENKLNITLPSGTSVKTNSIIKITVLDSCVNTKITGKIRNSTQNRIIIDQPMTLTFIYSSSIGKWIEIQKQLL